MNRQNAALLDEFCDAVWLEDGLARNTLESYRRDLRLFGDWHERHGGSSLLRATEADLAAYFASRSAQHPAGKKRGIRSRRTATASSRIFCHSATNLRELGKSCSASSTGGASIRRS